MPDKGSLRYLYTIKEKWGLIPPILNAGAGNPVEQRYYLPAYREFPYFHLDHQSFEGIDIVADLCSMPQVESESYGTIVSFDTLEHVAYPHQAFKEFYRILKKNGYLILSTVMSYSVHRWSKLKNGEGFGESNFMDYWRFCPDGIKLLFQDAGFKLLHLQLGQSNLNLAKFPIGEGADKQAEPFIYATGIKEL